MTVNRKRGPGDVVRLKDKERGHVVLNIRDGVVVGATGSEPDRFIGATLERAKRIARYGGDGRSTAKTPAKTPAQLQREIDDALGAGPFAVVVTWIEDITWFASDQKSWRHDLGERPKLVDVKKAHAAIWLNDGSASDVVKARAYVSKFHPGSGRVFAYPMSERDPLGRARREALAAQ